MAVIIYGSLQSTCTQRVLLTCHEIGIQYELKNINMMRGEHKNADFVIEFHPFGRIPVMEDGQTRLFESRAICQYLITKYASQDSGLRSPSEASALGLFEQMASIDYSYFEPSMGKLGYEKKFKKMMGKGETDQAQIDQAYNTLTTCLDYYEKHLAKTPFVSGEIFGSLDVYLMPWFQVLPFLEMENELATRPNIQKWWTKVAARSSWQAVVKMFPY